MRRDRERGSIEDRVTDPPEDTGPRRLAAGCSIAIAAAILLVLSGGLLVGAWNRFAAPAIAGGKADREARDPGDPARPTEPISRSADPLADMRRRYIPGPHVRIEGMIPMLDPIGASGRPGAGRRGRTADTPWDVLGARYEPGPPPSTTPDPAPTVLHAPGEPVASPLVVLPGVPAIARVRAADASGGFAVTAYAVAFDGYPGHFVLRATVQTELGMVSAGGSDGAALRFTIGAAIRPDRSIARPRESFRVIARIAAIDDQGRTSRYVSREVAILPVGTGDLEVALAMSEPSDLDLYLTDPSGQTIYYGASRGASGGELDLDANAACSRNMGIDHEHVFFPSGLAPRGTYSVRVAHFESCVQGRPIEYRVTVRACGETVVLVGRFAGMGRAEPCIGRAEDPSWCQDVVRFLVPLCRLPPNSR